MLLKLKNRKRSYKGKVDRSANPIKKIIKNAEEMSLYDRVSKKNYKIILYAYACIHYYLIIIK
jgi:hypothetical protein